jgi:hypothetical protein
MLRPNDVRDWLDRKPFRPFRIHLTNGTTFDVRHPEQSVVTRNAMNVAVPFPPGVAAGVQKEVTVALLHVTHLEPLGPPGTPSSN